MPRFAVSAVTCRQAEIFANDLQHLHGLVRPLDALLAQIGQFDILNVAVNCGGRHTFSFSFLSSTLFCCASWRGKREKKLTVDDQKVIEFQ
jgi:hypothetical protein